MESNSTSADSATESKPPQRAALVFIFVTIVLDVLSLGVTIPVAPKLIEGMIFQQTVSTEVAQLTRTADRASQVIELRRASLDETQARQQLMDRLAVDAEGAGQLLAVPLDNITARASDFVGLFGTVWALMQFVFAPILGALSDRFGRRKIILLSCLGLGLDYVLMALAPNLIWLFLGRVLSGITAASFSTAGAYIADVTPPEKRAASYGLFGAAWGFGFVVGPAVGGLLGEAGLRIPFWTAAVLALTNVAYGFFILPESLSVSNRSKFSWRKANPVGSLKLLRSHPELLGLATVLLIYQLAHQVFPSVFVLYAGYRYSWGARAVGLTLMVVGLVSVVMQGYVVRKTASWLGEKRMLFIALFFGAVGYCVYGVANSGWVFCSAIPVFALVGYFSPAMQSLMTRRVGPSEQGQLQGANSSLMGIAGMVGPIMFTSIFAWAIRDDRQQQLPGAPFLVATALHVVAIAVAWWVLRRAKPEPSDELPLAAEETPRQDANTILE